MAVVNTSKTAVIYQRRIMSPTNIILSITIVIVRNSLVVIREKASTNNIGKLRKIRKLSITFIFTINIKKYSFIVVLIFISAIFDDAQIAGNIHLSPRTISYLAYAIIVFMTIENR